MSDPKKGYPQCAVCGKEVDELISRPQDSPYILVLEIKCHGQEEHRTIEGM